MTELERLESKLNDREPADCLEVLKQVHLAYPAYRILDDVKPTRVFIGADREPVLFDEFRERAIKQVKEWQTKERSRFAEILRVTGVPSDESLRISTELRSVHAAERSAKAAIYSALFSALSFLVAIYFSLKK